MGPIQTYYYLAIICATLLLAVFVFVWVAARQIRRVFAEGRQPLTGWVIAGAVVLTFLFFALTGAGILIALVLHGSAT